MKLSIALPLATYPDGPPADAATVLARDVGEAPDIPKADGGARVARMKPARLDHCSRMGAGRAVEVPTADGVATGGAESRDGTLRGDGHEIAAIAVRRFIGSHWRHGQQVAARGGPVHPLSIMGIFQHQAQARPIRRFTEHPRNRRGGARLALTPASGDRGRGAVDGIGPGRATVPGLRRSGVGQSGQQRGRKPQAHATWSGRRSPRRRRRRSTRR